MDRFWIWSARLLLVGGIGCAPAVVTAGEFLVTPSLALDEKFTDNALATSSNRKADLVTSINPGLKAEGKGNQFDFALDYQPAYDVYASNSQLDGWRHEGIGAGRAELLKDWLFLDVRGAISEENANPTGPGASLDRTSPVNRLQVATWSVAPSLRHAFADQALAQLSFRHDEVAYRRSAASSAASPATVADSTGDGGRLELRTGEAYVATQAGYTAAADRVDRANMVFTHVSHTGRGEQMVAQGVSLLGHVGHDRISDPQVDGDRYGGMFYGGGLHWVPGEKSDLRAEVGRRYDGLAVEALGTLKVTGLTTLKLAHSTNLETEEQTLADSLSRVERDAEGHFIDPFSGLQAAPTASPFSRSTAVFKQRRTDLAVQRGDDISQVTLSGGVVNRRSLSSGSPSSTSALVTALTFDRRIREDLSATAMVGMDDIYHGTAASDRGLAFKGLLGLNYRINPNTLARASYRYVSTQPDQGASVHENMLSVGARMTF